MHPQHSGHQNRPRECRYTFDGRVTLLSRTDHPPSPRALDAVLKDTAKLKAVLSYHIIRGHVDARDVKAGEVMTVQGSALTAAVSSSGVQVNGAHVKQADIEASNGVVHSIDTVIMPKTWQLLAAAA